MRKLAAALAALTLSLPIKTFALGVGDLEWQSSLNQPLSAEIKLLSYESLGLNDITVKLAPFEAYQKSGIDYPPVLRNLKFNVEQRENGELYIKVTSNKSIRDPFLDILIDIDWPSGHLLREYTLLLDLPVFTDEEPEAIAAPAASEPLMPEIMTAEEETLSVSPQTVSSSAAAMDSGASSVSSSGVTSGPQGELRYGVVKRGDTLWEIAARMRSDDSVSVQQVMMTLLKDNPDAFYNNNINSLKAGYVLRINDPDSIASISRTEAARDAHRQYNRWLDEKKAKGELTTRTPAGEELAVNAVEGGPGPRLKLVAPDASEMSAVMGGGGASKTGQGSDGTAEELSSAIMSADVSRKENADLRERIARLEAQIGEMQRLLTLRDDTLSVLQNQEDVAAVVEEPVKEQVAPAAPVKPEPAAVVKPKAVKPAPVEKSLIDTLMDDPKLMGIAGVVILLLLLLVKKMLGRRKDESVDEQAVGQSGDQVAKASAQGNAENVSSDALLGDDLSPGLVTADGGMPMIQAEVDEIDVLAEADVYLAYQRFDRAEELLNDAISHDPENYELVVKLLDVYIFSDNKDAFIRTAEKLHQDTAESDPALWARVLPMGAKFAGAHALFSSYTPAQSGVESEIPGAELEAELGQLEGEDFLSEGEQGLDVSDLEGLDFDLGDLGDLGDLDDLDGLDKSDKKTDVHQDEPVEEVGEEAGDDIDIAENDELALNADADTGLEGVMDFDVESPLEDIDLDDEKNPGDESTQSESTQSESTVDAVMSVNGEVSDKSSDELSATLDFESEISSEGALSSTEETQKLNEDDFSDDNSLDFETTDLKDTDTADLVADEVEIVSESDDGLSLDVDEHGIEFDGVLENEVDAVEVDVDKEILDTADEGLSNQDETESLPEDDLEFVSSDDSVSVVGEEELLVSENDQKAPVDQDLEDDIDWLASVADDEVLLDEESDNNNLFSGDDEVATKLDLVRAYIDMGDKDSARDILNEVLVEGDDGQKTEASELLERINA